MRWRASKVSKESAGTETDRRSRNGVLKKQGTRMTKALLLLTIQAIGILCLENSQLASNPQDRRWAIRVSILAYDRGVEVAQGSCIQTFIVRREKSGKPTEP